MSYVERHQLYDAALNIWRSTDRYKVNFGLCYSFWTLNPVVAGGSQPLRRLAV